MKRPAGTGGTTFQIESRSLLERARVRLDDSPQCSSLVIDFLDPRKVRLIETPKEALLVRTPEALHDKPYLHKIDAGEEPFLEPLLQLSNGCFI